MPTIIIFEVKPVSGLQIFQLVKSASEWLLRHTIVSPYSKFTVQLTINEFLQIQKAYTTGKYVSIYWWKELVF